jgi:hypothetical protein
MQIDPNDRLLPPKEEKKSNGQGTQFFIAFIVLISIGLSFLYFRFGAIDPCTIVKKEAERILFKQSMSELSNNQFSGLFGMLLPKIVSGIVDQLTPAQCIKYIFKMDELAEIMRPKGRDDLRKIP